MANYQYTMITRLLENNGLITPEDAGRLKDEMQKAESKQDKSNFVKKMDAFFSTAYGVFVFVITYIIFDNIIYNINKKRLQESEADQLESIITQKIHQRLIQKFDANV